MKLTFFLIIFAFAVTATSGFATTGTIDLASILHDIVDTDGSATFEIDVDNSHIEWKISAPKIRVGNFTIEHVLIVGQSDPDQLHISTLQGSLGQYPFKLTKPITLTFGPNIDVSPVEFTFGPGVVQAAFEKISREELKGKIAMQGKLESLLEPFLSTKTPLTGDIALSLAISGTPDAPSVDGTIDLQNGTFEILNIGASVKNLLGQAEIHGNILTLTKLSGTSHDTGTLKGTGKASLDFAQNFPFTLDLELHKIGFIPFQYAEAIGSGHIQFAGDLVGSTVKGKVEADYLHVVFPEQMPESIQTVDVSYTNEEGKSDHSKSSSKNVAWPVAFDLDLEVPKEGMVMGRDWTSEWKGAVKLSGTTNGILLQGSCHVVTGQYQFNGKAFEIKEGNIAFAGDPEKKTSLYVIASRDLDEIKAEIILKGSLKKPSISFRSNPPLPQREIVSWILFNRGTSDISAFQGTQLNESITNLGGNNQKDVLSKIRDRIGIDRIDIDRGEHGTSDEVSVEVGKYISQGIYVSVSKGVTAEANRLAIEADVLKNVKVQGEVGDDAQGLLLLKWKRDY